MFDGILYNMLTSLVRGLMFAIAGDLGLTGNTSQQFQAAGLAILAGLWAWYEKTGHQKILNMLKARGGTSAVIAAKNSTLAETKAAAKALLFLAAILPALYYSSPSLAQMVTKSPPIVAPVSACPPQCSGFTFGAGAAGVGSNLDILGGGLSNSVFAGGGIPYAEIGYQFDNGTYFFGGELRIGDQFATGASTPTASGNENGMFYEECVKLGLSLSGILNGGTLPQIPSSFAAALVSPYAGACGVQRPFAKGWATVAGLEFALTSNWLLKAEYQFINYGNASNGAAAFSQENLGMVGVVYRFQPGTSILSGLLK